MATGRNWRTLIAWVALSGLFVGVLSIHITRPWVGAHDWNGAAWSIAARNILREGWAGTSFVASLHPGPPPLPVESFYVHHPPLIVWTVALSFGVFGEQEWAARLVPILASCGSVVILARLLARVEGSTAALVGCVALVMTPAQLYYGKMPNHEPLGLFFMLLAGWSFWNWQGAQRRRWRALGLLAVILAGLSAWPAYIFAAGLAIGLVRIEAGKRAAAGVIVAAAATFAILLWQMRTVRPDAWQNLAIALVSRSGLAAVTLDHWLVTVWGHGVKLLSPIGVAMLLIVGILSARRAPQRVAGYGALVVGPLALAAAGNLVLFREGAVTHEYYGFYCSGLVGLAAARFATLLGIDRAQEAGMPRVVAITLLAAMAIHALGAWRSLDAQQSLFFIDQPESIHFVRRLGTFIQREFPADATVLINAIDHGPQLGYYANRVVTPPKSGAFASEEQDTLDDATGGMIYLGYPAERRAWEALRRRISAIRPPAFTLRTLSVDGHEFGVIVPIRPKD